jgi:hypothetical protein
MVRCTKGLNVGRIERGAAAAPRLDVVDVAAALGASRHLAERPLREDGAAKSEPVGARVESVGWHSGAPAVTFGHVIAAALPFRPHPLATACRRRPPAAGPVLRGLQPLIRFIETSLNRIIRAEEAVTTGN